MSHARLVARNTFFLTISRVLGALMSFVSSILLARYLGVEGYGTLSLALALALIVSLFADFGLAMLTTREVARDRSLASKYIANVLSVQIVFAPILIGLVALFVNISGYSQQTISVVYIISVGIILAVLSTSISAIFQAHEQMEFMSIGAVLTYSATLCGILIGIRLHVDVVGFAVFYLIAYGIVLAYYYLTCARMFFLPRLEADLVFWRSIVCEAWPIAVVAVSSFLYFRIDAIILSLIKGVGEVGLYSVAYSFSEATAVIPSMFVAALFPLISKLHDGSKQAFVDTCAKSLKYVLCLALPIALVVTLWAEPIVETFYGSAFSGSAIALQIIIWSGAAIYITTILRSVFVSANLQRLNMAITVALVALNVLINVLVIPRYGYLGASATTVATDVFAVFMGIFFLGRHGYNLHMRRLSLPPVFGLTITIITSAILLFCGVHLLLITAIDLAIYVTILFKLSLDAEDKRLIASLFKR